MEVTPSTAARPVPSLGAIERAAASIRYHDMGPLVGEPGIAVTWRDASGADRAALVLDRVIPMRLAFAEAYDAGADLAAEMSRLVDLAFARPSGRDTAEVLRFLFPGPKDRPLSHVGTRGDGESEDAHLSAQRAQARAALRAPSLPADMRHALHAVLDHGLTDVADRIAPTRALVSMRRRMDAEPPLWDLVAFLARNPFLHLLAQDTAGVLKHVAEGVRVDEAFRREFPGLTDRHLDAMREDAAAGGLTFECLVGRAMHGHANMLRTLCAVPPEWVPRTDDQWRALLPLSQCVDDYASSTGNTVPALLASVHGDWHGYVRRAIRAASDDGIGSDVGNNRIRVYEADLQDAVATLAREVVLPAMAHSALGRDGNLTVRWDRPEIVARRMLYGGRSIPAALRISRRWHDRLHAIQAAVVSGGKSFVWAPLFDSPIRLGDVEVVPISDSASLVEEGSAGPDRAGVPGLSHCVATRMVTYARGTGHVLSLRRILPDGCYERLSTAEVRVDSDAQGTRIHCWEHRGLRNGAVPGEALEALAVIVGMVGEGRLRVSAAALAPREPVPDRDVIAEQCGYDWRDGKAVANAIRAWADVLPRWARGLGPDEFLAACVRQGVLPEGWQGSGAWE